MFRTLREQYGLTQHDIALQTGRTPNYILKAENETFPSPSPALMQFFLDLDPDLDRRFLTDWYHASQLKTRHKWLETWTPSDLAHPIFRLNWVTLNAGRMNPMNPTQNPMNPTQYALSQGLCIPAAVVYKMENGGLIPSAVGAILDTLVSYTSSGEYDTGSEDTAYDVTDRLLRIREDFT